MHIFGLHWSMSKLNFVSSLLVEVCFPLVETRPNLFSMQHNFRRYLQWLWFFYNCIIVSWHVSTLWGSIVFCFLLGTLHCQRTSVSVFPSSADVQNDLSLLTKELSDLFKASTGAGSYFGATIPNTMTNIYLHNVVWEQSNPLPFQNLAFCILTLCSCLIRSLSSMSPSLDRSGKLRVPLGKTESLLDCICGSTWFLGTLAAPSLAVVDWHKHQSFSWLRTNVVLSPSHYASCAVPATSLI